MNQRQKLLLLGITGALFVVTSILLVAAVTNQGAVALNAPSQEEPTPTVTHEQAVSIAAATLGGQTGNAELERENGKLQYSVEIDQANKEFAVKIDPYTGAIIKIEEETDVGAQEVALVQAVITQEQAIQLAVAQIPGTVQEVEVEQVNGVYVYEIEIDYQNREFDVSVDLERGQVVKIEEELQETEPEQSTSQPPSQSTSNAPITRSEAEQIALDEVGGGSVGEVDNDTYRGNTAWEVEVRHNGNEYDVLIDKQTGKVLDVEEDD